MRRAPCIAAGVVLAGLVLTPDPAAADPGRVVALLLHAKGSETSPLVSALGSTLRANANEISTLRMVSLDEPTSAGGEPSSTTCATLRCIARMGRDAGADEILIGRIKASPDAPGSVLVQLIAVNSQDGAILRKTAFRVASPEAIARAVTSHWAVIYGIDGVGHVEVLGSTADLKVDNAVVGKGPGPFDLAAGPHELVLADRSVRIVVLPGQTVQAKELALAPAPASKAVSSVPAVSKAQPAEEPGHLMTYSGIGLGALGLVALSTGAYFASSSSSLNGEVEAVRPGGGRTQVEAQDLNERAVRAARNANILLIAGAAATAVGATLLALDLWILDSDATTSVVLQSDGNAVSAGVALSW